MSQTEMVDTRIFDNKMSRTIGILALLLAIVLASVYQSCGQPKVNFQKFPPIGQTILIKPTVNAKDIKANTDYQNVLIYFVMGSKNLLYEDKTVIQMFQSDRDDTPIYQFEPHELRDMWQTTSCPRSLYGYLENAMLGDALFCNHSIDLSKIYFIKAIKSNGETKTCTSYVVEMTNEADDLIAVTIRLF